MNDYRAKTLKETFRLCDVDPLVGAGLERYYVNLTPVRKTEAIDGINTILEFQDPGDFWHTPVYRASGVWQKYGTSADSSLVGAGLSSHLSRSQ